MRHSFERPSFWKRLCTPKFVKADANLCPECDRPLGKGKRTIVMYFDPKMREAECIDRKCECGYEDRELLRHL